MRDFLLMILSLCICHSTVAQGSEKTQKKYKVEGDTIYFKKYKGIIIDNPSLYNTTQLAFKPTKEEILRLESQIQPQYIDACKRYIEFRDQKLNADSVVFPILGLIKSRKNHQLRSSRI